MGINRRDLKKNLTPPYCEICGYDLFVTRHRIKPGRKGGKYVPGNVIGLCPNCHWEADNGHFTQYELFSIVQARMRRSRKNGAHHPLSQEINHRYLGISQHGDAQGERSASSEGLAASG